MQQKQPHFASIKLPEKIEKNELDIPISFRYNKSTITTEGGKYYEYK